ncbi:hypothetical protein [Clostridium peptidivorans]|uniref:hypothetical protein n=1 Tax=Clostridium peptidivorans TaxID=100174 RepID=UPI0011784A0B|nr:hypothetical protein [Clostridium peptidivorans]
MINISRPIGLRAYQPFGKYQFIKRNFRQSEIPSSSSVDEDIFNVEHKYGICIVESIEQAIKSSLFLTLKHR